jgi:hypothetical protein
MGAWGYGAFDNDDAADWVAELASGGFDSIEAALQEVTTSDYVDGYAGARGVAAADVVARLVSGSGDTNAYSKDVAAWVGANQQQVVPALIEASRETLRRIRSDESELLELWRESGDAYHGWVDTLNDIARRLLS